MKIKKYQAKTFAEALVLVKKELSEDAIILSTEEKGGDTPFVEVTAAVDYDINKIRPIKDKREMHKDHLRKDSTGKAAPVKPTPTEPPAPVQTPQSAQEKSPKEDPPAKTVTPAPDPKVKIAETYTADFKLLVKRLTEDIKGEIESLRDTLQDMKNLGYEMALPPKKRMLLYFLRERSIREEYAILLCEKARDVNDVLPLLLGNLKVKKRGSDMKAIMLLGPTGVGKTTTVAKLAANSIKEGKKAAIINLDTYRIGAVEQVRIYARILGIPLSVVTNTKELKSNLMRYAETKDVIYIDTTGRSPKDEEYLEGINDICQTEVPLELHLIMSVNSDDEFLTEAYKYYRRLPINYLGFTKVDEAVRFGSIYNLLMTYQKPIAYLTTGQKVPDDIEFATVDLLANLILKKGVL
ncbi:MAG: flagellar biosynthesis protein FlhF [Nitrospirae bacterium]|uniref:flagellar biosynthesis protein FlhF n=1 Tax=Candidatus Magnetobacterium casense TaxID=1455061 RepID=UPI00058AFF3D|nr:flagellar biosynthesis protein FlhF [Candidatus Magnetobacterium casensis]MBF0338146.1 flagellar biosynthesis protein FlhF [Nitrospirota bacterium]